MIDYLLGVLFTGAVMVVSYYAGKRRERSWWAGRSADELFELAHERERWEYARRCWRTMDLANETEGATHDRA